MHTRNLGLKMEYMESEDVRSNFYFNQTGLYEVRMSVLNFCKYIPFNLQPKSGIQPNWKDLIDAQF